GEPHPADLDMRTVVQNRIFLDGYLLGEIVPFLGPALKLLSSTFAFAKDRFPRMRRALVILLVHRKKRFDEFVGREFAIEAEHCRSFGALGRSMLRPSKDFARSGLRAFSVMADGVHQRFVRHNKKDRRIFGGIFMTVKIP